MKLKQYKDGSCDIIFSKSESKIINEQNKIHLTDEFLRHFGNNLVKMVADWNLKFSEDIKNLETKEGMEIKTQKIK